MGSTAELVTWFLLAVSVPIHGYYVALVPKTIQDESQVVMVISNIGDNKGSQFNMKYTNLQNNRVTQDEISLLPRTVQDIRSKEVLKSGMYSLEISDKNTGKALDNLDITVDNSHLSVYIQTDKPRYKPVDTVKFRVLVLDNKLAPPSNLKAINVNVKDSKNRLIKEWSYGKLEQGVFQSEFELANFVTLGDWSISATVFNGKTTKKIFTVSEKILPQHRIAITCSDEATYNDEQLKLLVNAKYIFEEPIVGKLTVSLTDTDIKIVRDIEGFEAIDINMEDLRKIRGFRSQDVYWLNVIAHIKENGSGNSYEHREMIPVFSTKHKVTLKKSSEYIHPEINFKYWLTLTNPKSGNPIVGKDLTIKVERGETTSEFTNTTNHRGIVELEVEASESLQPLYLEVVYAGESTELTIESKSDNTRDLHLTAIVHTEEPKPYEPVNVTVISSLDLDSYVYFVIARGQIVAKGIVPWQSSKRRSSFSFTATPGMFPSASVAILAVHSGELKQHVVHFRMTSMANHVEISSEMDPKPGASVLLTVRSQPGSIVWLSAVDKAILSPGDENHMTFQSLIDDANAQHSKIIEDLGFTVLSNARMWVDTSTRSNDDDEQEDDRVRMNFPESWLWFYNYTDTGNYTLSVTIPDSITRWSISAFATNEEHGLAVINEPIEITIRKDFFVTINMPFSILLGETVVVDVFVHCYLDCNTTATVTISIEHGDFELLNDHDTNTINPLGRGVHKTSFRLQPKKSGDLKINIVARTNSNKVDKIQRAIKVKPQGETIFRNEARYIAVADSTQQVNGLQLHIHDKATTDSVNITFSVEGSVLGSALSDLNGLIRLPTGCGEQNMVKLVPSTIALEYMNVVKTLSDSLKSTAKDYLRKGYQNQLNYQLSDGSFAVFQDKSYQSLFLTALAAKTLRVAGKHIDVDSSVVDRAYQWIEKQQSRPSGMFKETGLSSAMRGGSSDGVTLTAYTVIAILEDKKSKQRYNNVVRSGMEFITNKLDTLSKPFDLAIVSYALHLDNHPRKNATLDKLLKLSQYNDKSDMRWWEDGSLNIETTSYALLTMLHRGMYVDAVPVMKWLVSQRYDKGGYSNTQDTFLGLQALAEYSTKLPRSSNDYEVSVSYGDDRRQVLKVNDQNSLVHEISLPSDVRKLNVSITGTGTGVFQVAYQYNLLVWDDQPSFGVNKTVKTSESNTVISLEVCAWYKQATKNQQPDMVLMEIHLPSGFIVSDESVQKLTRAKRISMVERKNDDTLLVLYYNSLKVNETVCVDVSALKKAAVLGSISGLIKVYDYSKPAQESILRFEPKNNG